MTETSATGDDVGGMGENSGDTVRGQEDGLHPDLPYVSSDDVDGSEQTEQQGQSGQQSTDAVDSGANAGASDTPGLGDMDDVVPGAGAIEPPD
jgi:hypothetical protein